MNSPVSNSPAEAGAAKGWYRFSSEEQNEAECIDSGVVELMPVSSGAVECRETTEVSLGTGTLSGSTDGSEESWFSAPARRGAPSSIEVGPSTDESGPLGPCSLHHF